MLRNEFKLLIVCLFSRIQGQEFVWVEVCVMLSFVVPSTAQTCNLLDDCNDFYSLKLLRYRSLTINQAGGILAMATFSILLFNPFTLSQSSLLSPFLLFH